MQNCANYGQHLLPQASGLGSGTVGVWCQGVVVAVWGHGKLWGGARKKEGNPLRLHQRQVCSSKWLLITASSCKRSPMSGRHCRRLRLVVVGLWTEVGMAMESELLSLVCIIYCNETAGCCGGFSGDLWGEVGGKGHERRL